MCHSTAEKREVPSEGKRPPQSDEVALLTSRVSIAAAVVSIVAIVPCVTAPQKRGKSPAKGNVPHSLMKLHFSLCELASWLLPEVARQSSIVGAPTRGARLSPRGASV